MVNRPERMSGQFEKEYFQETYRDYARQNPTRKLRCYVDALRDVVPARELSRLLDVGCGLGAFLAHMRSTDPTERSWYLAGVDVSTFAIESNRALLPSIDFRVAGASEVDNLGLTFDVVTAFDVLEHIDDLDAAALAIKRALKPNGGLVFVVPVYDGLLGPLVRFLDKDPTHVHQKPKQWWLDWASTHFEIVRWRGFMRLLTPWGYYVHVEPRWAKTQATAILVTALAKQTP